MYRKEANLAWIYTIGYESRRVDELALQFADEGIELLVDVRSRAWSRKRDFSRSALEIAFSGHEILYMHVPDLGAPDSLRKELYETGDYESFFLAYRAHLANHLELADNLATMLLRNPGCLMCLEYDPDKCHRSVLAGLLLARFPDFEGIRHLSRAELVLGRNGSDLRVEDSHYDPRLRVQEHCSDEEM